MKALTIKQPWASLIAAGIKDVENRSWTTRYRGPLLIHAGAAWDANGESAMIVRGIECEVPRGGIIARAQLVDVVRDSDSEWAESDSFHWILRDVEPIEFEPCRGALGLWEHGERIMPEPPPSLF